MGRTACTEPQFLYKGALYLYLTVELYLYSPYGPYGLYRPSVPVQGVHFTFFYLSNLCVPGGQFSLFLQLRVLWKAIQIIIRILYCVCGGEHDRIGNHNMNYNMCPHIFYGERPHLSLWGCSRAAREKITVSGIHKPINYCEIFIVYTQY
jgi:hypothetical protein